MKAAKWGVGLAVVVALVMLAATRLSPPPILIENAVLQPVDGGLALTLSLTNKGGPDWLVAARSADAEVGVMGGALPLAVPGGARPSLALDGAHLMLRALTGAPEAGRLVPVTLVFERAGEVATRARIDTPAAMDHAAMGHGEMQMEGAPLSGTIPTMTVTPEGAGWRVTLDAPALTFSAEAADGPHQPGVGHGHLYLGGLKVQRLYQPQAVIGALPPGRHTVRVSLNTNDHRPYLADGAPITMEQVIEVR